MYLTISAFVNSLAGLPKNETTLLGFSSNSLLIVIKINETTLLQS